MSSFSTKRIAVTAIDIPVAPGCSQIRWWRSISAPNFHSMALSTMKATVEKFEILDEPRWRDAVVGDAAAAMCLAIDFERKSVMPGKLDLVMTSVVICACEGNASACVVLSNIIRRLPNTGEREARIATSWLMRAFRPLAERHLTRG